MEAIQFWFEDHLQHTWWRLVLILTATLGAALLLRLCVQPLGNRLVRRTAWTLDDEILDIVWPAARQTVFLVGVNLALRDVVSSVRVDGWIAAAVTTILVIVWGRTANASGSLVCAKLARNFDRVRWIEPRTLPLIQFVQKVVIFGLMTYFIMSAWQINLTGWLASAGVAGIAVGFAAKDTLANFISGVFILMDAPYQVGQFIIIDGVTRGQVTDIGMRSTRILTRGNVEVTVPNAVIANAKVVNESSGPTTSMRVQVDVGVAYGSDVDQVREILTGCTVDIPNTVENPQAKVRFIAMGDSGLLFRVRVFIADPAFRGRIVDELNTRIYKALTAAGIEIPFPQQDLYVREWPTPPRG